MQELTGSEFGPDPSVSCSRDTVDRVVDFADFFSGALLPQPGVSPVQSWGPSSIRVFTTLAQARVRVRIGSVSWTGSLQNSSVSSWMTFQSFAPSVAALTGSISNISTTGTTLRVFATAQVMYMQTATAIRVLVGGVDAVIVDPSTGAAQTPTSAVAIARATLTTDGYEFISFNIPPGQGSSNAMQVRSVASSYSESPLQSLYHPLPSLPGVASGKQRVAAIVWRGWLGRVVCCPVTVSSRPAVPHGLVCHGYSIQLIEHCCAQ